MADAAKLTAPTVPVTTGPAARARAEWQRLGRAGEVQRCTGDDSDSLAALGEVLTGLDERLPLGTVLSVCVQLGSVVPLLRGLADGSEYVGGVLAAALRGEAVVGLAVTDGACAGSDLMMLGTRADKDDSSNQLSLRGRKEWITGATWCDYLLVLARRREANHFTSFGWFLVPSAVVTVQPTGSALFADAGTGDVELNLDCVEPAWCVGRPTRAMAEFIGVVARERIAGALWGRAMCRRVLVDTRAQLVARPGVAAASTLWDDAAVRSRFAELVVDWSALAAAAAAAASEPVRPATAMLLKVMTAQTVDRVLSGCAEMLGAAAFRDGGLASIRAEAAMFGVAGGATGALLAGIAEHAEEVLAPSPVRSG